MQSFAEVFQHVITGPHGEGNDRHGRSLVRGIGKDAGVANIQIRRIVGRGPFIRYESLCIVSETAEAGLVFTVFRPASVRRATRSSGLT